MISWLLLGLVMGVRHALEADHLAAVANLSADSRSPRELLRVAGAWGLGHGLTLVLLALLWLAAGVSVPERGQPFVEAAAGVLLIVLGADLLRRRDPAGLRFRAHRHADGTRHLHAHRRDPVDPGCAEHPHATHPVKRALVVGAIHGAGGSALLGLFAAGGALPARTLAYAIMFGVGATLGMLLLSAAISLPLRLAPVHSLASGRWLRVALACGSIAIGIWISGHALLPVVAPLVG
jgi:ABC-type nickel/cobalt efflux system permease component RcnA